MTEELEPVTRTNMPYLSVYNLCKSFTTNGRTRLILRNVELNIEAGQFVVLLGPSGCGKSTLLRIIAGLEFADLDPAPELTLNGQAIVGPGLDRGFVFQSYSSFPWWTVRQNVMFALRRSVGDPDERKRRVEHYLALVGLQNHADFYPKDLSGGQQQRIAIARTLAANPRLLLMDEPYAALDAQNREAQQAILLRIWRESRPTILFVTHDIAEAVFLGSRVVVMGHSPAELVEDLDTEKELERKIAARTSQPGLSIMDRGQWIREQPEFYELIAHLKQRLPRPLED